MSLDINTPNGQESLRQAREAIDIWHRHYPMYRFIETPQERPGVVDGVIVKDGVILRVVEIKSRSMDKDTFWNKFNGEWLVTHKKVEDLITVAKMLAVPAMGWLYLAPEKTLICDTLSDDAGNMTVPHRSEETETQETVNGGTVVRLNMFIDMKKAKVLK